MLDPADVTVEVYYGDVDRHGQIPKGHTVVMDTTKVLGNGVFRFEGGIPCDKTGQQGFTVRVIPHHEDLANKHETCLIAWA
jgi:starch phosphorylase